MNAQGALVEEPFCITWAVVFFLQGALDAKSGIGM